MTSSRPYTVPFTVPGFDAMIGLECIEAGENRVVMQWLIRQELHQPHGIVHGGVHCAAVEASASIGASLWWGDRGRVVGVSNQTDFLRAAREGVLRATATPVHRGRSQQLWQVEVVDDDQRLVARGQVRLQNLTGATGARTSAVGQ